MLNRISLIEEQVLYCIILYYSIYIKYKDKTREFGAEQINGKIKKQAKMSIPSIKGRIEMTTSDMDGG